MPEEIPAQEEEYELLPHREIEDLKEELSKLKEFEVAPSKKLQVSLLEVNAKLDKLITIFEDASHEMRVEEGGLSFTDKMRPLLEKMNKILEQNSEIASGILALADMVKEKSGRMESGFETYNAPPTPTGFNVPPKMAETPSVAPMPRQTASPQMAGPMPPGVPPGMPLPPLPKRRTFGL
jgi:hypothetical protein